MALKTIHFTVSANGGLSPSAAQEAGVQGNHRIYELLFEFSDELYAWLQEKGNEGKLVYRFDGYDGTGAVHHSDTAILCEKSVSYPLEYSLTRYGGLVKVELIITLVKECFEDGEVLPDITDEVLHTHAAQLKLIFSPYSAGDRDGQYLNMASLAEVAKANAEKAIMAAEEAIKAQKLTEELSAALQNGAEFIFDGGDASGDLDINFVVDNEMSDYSANPVANRVVKKYVKDTVSGYVDEKLEEFEDENIIEEADYVVEQGKDGNWTYRKWNSGIAECWGSEKIGFVPKDAWGALYTEIESDGGSKRITVNLPQKLFTEVQFNTVTICETGFLIIPCNQRCAAHCFIYTPLSLIRNFAHVSASAHYYVIGRWE